MVTIEQKLTLFSKLLNQDIKEESNKKFVDLEKEYDKRLAENKFETDKQATEIVEQARKKAELKKVELISRGKLSSKKEMMQTKEEMIAHFMMALETKIKAFTTSDGYKAYLDKIVKDLEALKGYENKLEVYLTQYDLEHYGSYIKEKLTALGIAPEKLSFHASEGEILGGMLIKDPVFNMRIDESIRAIVDEAKDQIVEKVSLAIGEAGEEIHE